MSFQDLRKAMPEITRRMIEIRKLCYQPGAIPVKYKAMIALAIATCSRCGPCAQAYVRMLKKEAVTREEFLETLQVCIGMGGSMIEQFSMEMLEFFDHQEEKEARKTSS